MGLSLVFWSTVPVRCSLASSTYCGLVMPWPFHFSRTDGISPGAATVHLEAKQGPRDHQQLC